MGIGTILFDLGNVLVHFPHQPIAAGLARWARREPYRDPREVYRFLFHPSRVSENPLDAGRLSPEAFFHRLRSEMELGLDFETFVGIWNPRFRPRRGAEALLRYLHGRVRMHLLSNTNPLHFEHVLSHFPVLRLMDSWFLSYEMGCMKPSPQVYQKVLDRLRRSPGELLFLDDMEENLVPAREMGIHTVRVGPEDCLFAAIEAYLPDLSWERSECRG